MSYLGSDGLKYLIEKLKSLLSGKVSTSRKINNKDLTADVTLTASDVGADVSGAASSALSSAKAYTDTAVKDKATATDLTSHTGNGVIHITATERTNWNTAKTHADSAHAPSNAEANQNAFSNIVVGATTISADSKTDTLTIAAGTGISVSGDATNDKVTIGNSGVRSIATGSSNGTISVNTNGTSADVSVKGLGSAAYKATSAFDAAGTAQTKADAALSSAKSYTDTKISNLINSAPTTLDTLGEIATAMEENADVVEALEDAIGTKANHGHTHTVSHTPTGTVSKPTFSGTAVNSGTPSGTTSVYSITGVGSAPSFSANVTNHCLTLSFDAGSVPTRSSVTVASSDHKHSVTATGTVSQPTFTGTAATLSTSADN